MRKEFEATPWPCHLRLTGKYLASGYDSAVYKDGGYVIKVYKGNPSAASLPVPGATLVLYRQVTNAAFEIAETEGLQMELIYSKETLPFKINPIITMEKCEECGFVESVAPHVPGKNLATGPDIFDPVELKLSLRYLNNALEDKLGVSGINIIPINIKEVDGGLVVTDLCSDIVNLRRKVQ